MTLLAWICALGLVGAFISSWILKIAIRDHSKTNDLSTMVTYTVVILIVSITSVLASAMQLWRMIKDCLQ